ncbi:MAG: hypothetical protein DRQ88_04695 [Epsilonproteobacteria bacterium]|nr:MAG: hypothetical protein DRQ89_06880 [Campylobacterota bacterium]RLA66937.1 MAG: hypothetical protein DRQ88_04695 [Campylobacterota bacterium]
MNYKVVGLVVFALIGILMATFKTKVPISMDTLKVDESIKLDTISANALSEMIIENNLGYTLIDLRDDASSAKLQVQGSIPMSYKNIVLKENYGNLLADKHIIVIANSHSKMLKATYFFKTKGLSALYVEGGFKAWQTQVLNPKAPNEYATDQEFLRYKYLIGISNYLQGKGQGGGTVKLKRKRRVLKRVNKVEADGGC